MTLGVAVLGVDPGTQGGLALLGHYGHVERVRVFSPSMREEELVDEVRQAVTHLRNLGSVACYFEKVGSLPSDGHMGAFTFGRVDGLLRGALRALGVRPRDVYPMAWQARLGCLSRGNKNVTKRRAIEIFPEVKVTHGVADALLIARYGWETLAL